MPLSSYITLCLVLLLKIVFIKFFTKVPYETPTAEFYFTETTETGTKLNKHNNFLRKRMTVSIVSW